MDNRKIFETPLCEIARIAVEDVITTSNLRTSWDTDEYAFVE